MKNLHTTDLDGLIDEIARYLAAVETFRVEGCAPVWLRESAAIALEVYGGRRTEVEKSAH